MHFDSFRNHAPLNTTYKKQPEILCLSPDPQDENAFSPSALCHLIPAEVEGSGKAIGQNVLEACQKTRWV